MSKFEITKLTGDQIKIAGPLFADTQYKSYRFLAGHGLDEYRLNELASISADPLITTFAAKSKGRPVGIISYADNPWETKLFGKKMGAIKNLVVNPNSTQRADAMHELLNHTIIWARRRGIDCLLCKTCTDDTLSIHELERQGFLLMDTLLDYVYDYRKSPFRVLPQPKPIPGNSVRLADENDVGQLTTLARAAFGKHFGRYNADERITRLQATQVYEEWINASFKGWADWILVAEINKQIAGFSIWKKPSQLEQSLPVRLGHYSIGAVHPAYYGRGIFSTLTYEGMKMFDGKVDCLEGPTHINNYPVQQTYTKLHWRIADARHSFHKWLTDN